MKRLAKVSSIIIIFVMLVSLFGVAPAQADGKLRVMVQFAPGQKANVEKALQGAGAEFHYAFDELDTFVISVPQAALKGLSKNPNIIMIEEDALRYPISIMPSAVQAPDAGSQVVPYSIDMVQARDVWDANRDDVVDAEAPTGAGRTIYIIDSGFWTEHEDLQGVTVDGYDGNLPWALDGGGHGTHVAGTIVAVNNTLGVIGVTPGTVSIYEVRVFGDDGAWAYSSTLVDATNRCKAAGANIISMSLGGSKSSRTEKTALANLYTAGILSIAAAGNEGTTALSYPAGYETVVSVAAIDATKAWADFSQYNSDVELAAPGVGVLSTVPYLDISEVTVDGVPYSGGHIEYSGRGTATGNLLNGGLCASATAGAWTGKVVLCERGEVDFAVKVLSVQTGGGVAAVIYNNVPGGFLGTMGESTATIPGISLSQEDGQYLVANKLGSLATVSSTYTPYVSRYEYYDGTSMATPHVSAVAALVWSSKPTATNAEIRAVLQQTAKDLGTVGRDVYYGYGLVQAKAAIDALGGTTPPPSGTIHVADLAGKAAKSGNGWKATVTISVVDENETPVSGAVVAGKFNTTAISCTTGTAGTCSVTSAKFSSSVLSVTYEVTGITLSGYTYVSADNFETSIIINKP